MFSFFHKLKKFKQIKTDESPLFVYHIWKPTQQITLGHLILLEFTTLTIVLKMNVELDINYYLAPYCKKLSKAPSI